MDIETDYVKPPISDIAPDGDVILVVGPDKAQLRVYSQCLRAASRGFNTMFGPAWSEGKGLSLQSPRNIPLPEDDASVLRTIFCLLHHRNTDVADPETLTSTEILNIAIASDKYDLAVALKYVSPKWLSPREDLELVDMGRLAVAALLMEDPEMFTTQTMELMLRWEGPYLGLLEDGIIGQFFPFKAVCLLEQRRSQMRAELANLMRDYSTHENSCANLTNCSWTSARNSAYTIIFERLRNTYGASMLLTCKLAHVFRHILEAMREDPLRSKITCGLRMPLHEPLTFDKSIAGQIEALKRRAGVCLDCIRGTSQCKTHPA